MAHESRPEVAALEKILPRPSVRAGQPRDGTALPDTARTIASGILGSGTAWSTTPSSIADLGMP